MTMCPYCNKQIRLENYVCSNVGTYGSSALAATLCCGNAVRVRRVVSFGVEAVSDHEGEDDWGVEFRAKTEEQQ